MPNLSTLPKLKYDRRAALPPQEKDLERLYDLIIQLRSTTVLEFGCGYSTFVIREALLENEIWFKSLPLVPELRNPYAFECHSIDTNMEWISEVKNKLPEDPENVFFYYSICEKTTFQDRICHSYTFLPNVCPDFIYLDGPDPMQVNGWGNYTPMSADILYLEPVLLPGTVVLVDGRTNNTRFLERNLQRDWSIIEDQKNDFTLMELDEPSLGSIIACGRDILEWQKENSQEKKRLES